MQLVDLVLWDYQKWHSFDESLHHGLLCRVYKKTRKGYRLVRFYSTFVFFGTYLKKQIKNKSIVKTRGAMKVGIREIIYSIDHKWESRVCFLIRF